jgi:hypothetical protein
MVLASQESAQVELIRMNLASLIVKTAIPTTIAPGLVLKLHTQPATQASTVSLAQFTSSPMTLLLEGFAPKEVTASVAPNILAHLELIHLLRVLPSAILVLQASIAMSQTELLSHLSAPTGTIALAVLESQINVRSVPTLRLTWRALSQSNSVQIARPAITATMVRLIDQRSAKPVSIVFQAQQLPMSRAVNAQLVSTVLKELNSPLPALMENILFLEPKLNLTALTVAQVTTVFGI